MREILFRGKRTDNGEWIYGDLLHYDSGEIAILNQFSRYGYEATEICRRTKVLPETVGQYTGLTDKNGKRIFEGDIVRHHNDNPDSGIEEKGVVFWDEKYCGWRRTSNGDFHHGIVDTYRLSPDCLYEVIGNIHDNPELLEVKK